MHATLKCTRAERQHPTLRCAAQECVRTFLATPRVTRLLRSLVAAHHRPVTTVRTAARTSAFISKLTLTANVDATLEDGALTT